MGIEAIEIFIDCSRRPGVQHCNTNCWKLSRDGQGKAQEKGLQCPVQVLELSPADGRALYHWELCVVHQLIVEMCVQTVSEHALSLRYSTYPDLVLALQSFGFKTLPHRLSTGGDLQGLLLIYSSSKKEAGWGLPILELPLDNNQSTHSCFNSNPTGRFQLLLSILIYL